MDEKPLLSVIVPVYNVEDYLDECVNSILNQTYKKIEIILVDDGSTDSSGCICDNYLTKDDRIRVVHKKNGGLSDARNAGIDVAKGDYIAFVDSDDYIDTTLYENMVKAMLEYNADIVRADYRMVGGNKYKDHSPHFPSKPVSIYQEFDALKMLLTDKLHLSAWDKLYKKSYVSITRFDKGVLNEDVRFLFELLRRQGRVVEIQIVGYNYRVRPGSITNSNMRSYHDLLKNLDYFKYITEKEQLPLSKEIKYYQTSCYIHFCYACLKKHTTLIEVETFKYCQKMIRKDLLSILFSRRTIKGKVLSLIISLKQF